MNKEVNLLDQRAREVLEGMIKVVILFQQLVFILISGIGIARSLLGASRFLTLKELGRK
jgi:hypothetical protein